MDLRPEVKNYKAYCDIGEAECVPTRNKKGSGIPHEWQVCLMLAWMLPRYILAPLAAYVIIRGTYSWLRYRSRRARQTPS